ncbi:hypothetical protein AVEN_202032-1 [Araneus ventricosus]|uniref:Uncharacterized protein n=1 Tax=Araneus ventricosus TaxID=182803 RepID=A0A4Y2V832_ARAVE|nr:hypothetical protein AVEN_193283-1 [Araneus ventricosus]GBO20575.1 hypothetical protein AVEN_202032-1 [Araneus ventricosus]
MNFSSQETVLESYRETSKKSVRQKSSEIGVSKSSIHRILRHSQRESCIPSMIHAINEDDPNRRKEGKQFFEWYLEKCEHDAQFPGKIVWSHEAMFKLKGTINLHDCIVTGQLQIHIL